MVEVTHERGITRARRNLLPGMNGTRTLPGRGKLRSHPGQLGPNPDLLVVGLLGVIVAVAVMVGVLSALGLS
ncbi:MAG: hypothetical protein ACRDO2_02035 [Nocardioidaceae bacterium]